MSEFTAGQEITNPYPFVQDNYIAYDEEGGYAKRTWNPGVSIEIVSDYGDTDVLAHGEGQQILTVVDVHKPGKYPTRVFYTRTWVDPDGRKFGKSKLHIATVEKFRRLSRGFNLKYDVEPLAEEIAA